MNGNKYDAAMQRIGYRIVNPDTWRAPSEEDLKRFEEKFGYALPKDYREFVLRFGVTASDGGEWVVRNADGVDAGGVDVFYGLSSGVSSYDLGYYVNRFDHDGLPSWMLPIASAPGGTKVVMSLAGDDHGSLYWWHPEEPFGADTTEHIAKDFDSFMRMLVRN